MGIFAEERKFKRKVKQTNPTNPTGSIYKNTNNFDISQDTIKEQQNQK